MYDLHSAKSSSAQVSGTIPTRNKSPGIAGQLFQIPQQCEETGYVGIKFFDKGGVPASYKERLYPYSLELSLTV